MRVVVIFSILISLLFLQGCNVVQEHVRERQLERNDPVNVVVTDEYTYLIDHGTIRDSQKGREFYETKHFRTDNRSLRGSHGSNMRVTAIRSQWYIRCNEKKRIHSDWRNVHYVNNEGWMRNITNPQGIQRIKDLEGDAARQIIVDFVCLDKEQREESRNELPVLLVD